MIKYVCKHCDDLMCETSKCPVCGSRTEILESKIFWCPHCNAPSFDEKCKKCGTECFYIGTDLRPVFPEERLLLEILMGEPFKYANSAVWNVGSNHYIIDGKRKNISYKELKQNNNVEEVISKLDMYSKKNKEYIDLFYESESVKKFIEINKQHLNMITFEAIEYIRKLAGSKSESEMFVSFSGGKDSTVTSDLVLNALDKNVIHIYGDTTLEYPASEIYLKRFRQNHPFVPVLTAKNKDQDFNNLCEVIGPPSRMLRWCCTVFKTGAITKKIDSTFKNVNSVITFQGIRRSESAARSKYDRESNDSKIKKQIAVNPIIDWLDFDVWLYILTTGIDFNDAYRLGYSRVGCWCCPNNGSWSEFLSKVHMYEQYVHWRKILVDFAKKIDKPDPEEYVDEGGWKARQGGNGIDIAERSIISYEPCATEDNAFNYELQKPITKEFYELFKPFGYINTQLGNERLGEVYVLDKKGNVVLVLQGRIGSTKLKVTIKNERLAGATSLKVAEGKIQCQLTKYQMCIGCKACESVCKHSAIKIKEMEDGSISYKIDDQKCKRCTECVNHFNAGCYVRKVLTIKREG